MSVTSVDQDIDTLTLTLIADFSAPAERVWELCADPRKLERWWGPPTHPSTFERHELEPGGTVTYFMTGPEGDRFHGWWKISEVDRPRSLAFTDGFADEHGNPAGDMPTTEARMELFAHEGGTRMELRSTFATREQMEELARMGMVEGLQQSVSQMDALLAG